MLRYLGTNNRSCDLVQSGIVTWGDTLVWVPAPRSPPQAPSLAATPLTRTSSIARR